MAVLRLPLRIRRILSVLLGGAIMTMPSGIAAAPTMTPGVWGARGVALTVEAKQIRIDLDTGAAVIDGPLQTDATGRFKAAGHFEHYLPGPQRADQPVAIHKVRIDGRVTGNTMALTMRVAGEAIARKYILTQGRRTKLIRPL